MMRRRWLWASATLAVLAAVAGPAAASTNVPDSRTMAPYDGALSRASRSMHPGINENRLYPGLDVSHWQGTINWSKVAGDGYNFVWAKATEGQTFEDPQYATNRSGAKAAGLLFGAYHFARPDSSANDAILEADHFADFAGPKSGELLPVLDVEDSGGLSTNSLINWVQAWLDRVHSDLGVRPVIYSGPYFWRTYMGDTTQFADEQYRNLWVPNWGVPEPDVPAQNWGGHGWTIWQWTDCGSVSGIAGCVDLDWMRKARQQRLIIR